ncbi:hypothetical protein ACXIUS_01450 [Bosea thiooxidans]
MTIINHGVWMPYEPVSRPAGAPPSAVYFKNDAGTDWYGYREATWPLDRQTMSDASDSLKIVVVDGIVSTVSDNAHAVTLGGGGLVLEVPAGTFVEPRWRYDEAAGSFAQPAAPVPNITQRQLRLWLVRNGYPLATVETALDNLPEPDRSEALIEWDCASEFKPDHPTLLAVAAVLGIPDVAQAAREAALI